MGKKNKIQLNLEYNNNFYTLFTIGYTADGGFFVKDLIGGKEEYLLYTAKIPEKVFQKIGITYIPKKEMDLKYWITKKSPKITHHINGNAHISGFGITSGFYKFFNGAKGIFIESMDLVKRNYDGGPIFIFVARDLSTISPSKTRKGIDIIQKDQIINYNPKILKITLLFWNFFI